MRDEILGTSDGTPNQRFALAHARTDPAVPRTGSGDSKDIILITEQATDSAGVDFARKLGVQPGRTEGLCAGNR